MSKHTPGPWVVECKKFIATPKAVVIAELNDGLQGEYPESGHINANATLIAAAPAMYEALSELVKYLREEVADEALDTWEPVFKAAMVLAQAEGRTL